MVCLRFVHMPGQRKHTSRTVQLVCLQKVAWEDTEEVCLRFVHIPRHAKIIFFMSTARLHTQQTGTTFCSHHKGFTPCRCAAGRSTIWISSLCYRKKQKSQRFQARDTAILIFKRSSHLHTRLYKMPLSLDGAAATIASPHLQDLPLS